MRRERIEKKQSKDPNRHLVLPLDPRDPAILRAKELASNQPSRRRRVA